MDATHDRSPVEPASCDPNADDPIGHTVNELRIAYSQLAETMSAIEAVKDTFVSAEADGSAEDSPADWANALKQISLAESAAQQLLDLATELSAQLPAQVPPRPLAATKRMA